MKLGRFEIYPVLDGFFRLDGGAMFGRVPKEIWKRLNPPDRQNRILLALRCLLIQTGKSNILIDTGIGNISNPEYIRRFAVDRYINLAYSLKQHGFLVDDIDVIVNTHLHFDHCGGNLLFPRAKFFIQGAEWEEALSNNTLTRASYQKEFFLPLYDRGAVELIRDQIFEVDSGITLLRTGGHSLGHQVVKIESGGQEAIYLGDLVPTASHLNYPFIMGYDIEPLETLKKKMEILPEAAKNNTLLIFEHEPKFEGAFIAIKDKKILVTAEVRL